MSEQTAMPAPPPARQDHDWYVAALAPEVDGFAAAISAADPGAPVPPCPDWAVRDLATHLGFVHRWATHLVVTRADGFVNRKDLGFEAPSADGELGAWLAEGGGALLEALRSTPGDTPVWAWGPDHHARFWSRRQLHETAMHRADAELALGQQPSIAPEVAVDGIDELLALFTSMRKVPERLAADGHENDTIHLHATDVDHGEWTLGVTPGGFTWAHDHAKGDVAVRASASDLLLALSNRIALDDPALEVFGDPGVLEHWRAATNI